MRVDELLLMHELCYTTVEMIANCTCQEPDPLGGDRFTEQTSLLLYPHKREPSKGSASADAFLTSLCLKA